MHDLNHVVEASDDVATKQVIYERNLALDFALENLKEVTDDISALKWRVFGCIVQENIVNISHELDLLNLTVDNFLPLW